MNYHCVYFKAPADAQALVAALKLLGIHATSFETMTESHAENMAESLRMANEMVRKAWAYHEHTKEQS
jgi:uncharacterized protein YqfB (UPF0267 family)